jgi:hypothetical protein
LIEWAAKIGLRAKCSKFFKAILLKYLLLLQK